MLADPSGGFSRSKDYLRCVDSVDENLGRVLDYLDEETALDKRRKDSKAEMTDEEKAEEVVEAMF